MDRAMGGTRRPVSRIRRLRSRRNHLAPGACHRSGLGEHDQQSRRAAGRFRPHTLGIRGRATGWVAACTKCGGLVAQLLSLLGLVPAFFIAALLILIPVAVSLLLVWRCCIETRGRDLRDLEGAPALG